ncbi:YjdF family protein [Nonomuraea sp. SMC257]|uniref:YjdF family protein n=1 Tax=Nonomuraea montanisoli TaxID=2741721 RepID=A0A7Y6IH88_9ACTN|nr:YjdF family protein [Nonomuraea montanisoli]NUW38190.1 YjdF family protein [Nonomuraea montanisoli]
MVTFSVYLDGPFWIGVLEIAEDGVLRVTRHTFGSEPTDPELYAFLMRHGVPLLEQASAAPPVPAGERTGRRVNPKRAAKLAARAAARVSTRSTAAQEAMRLELESRKREAAEGRRERRRELAEHKREVARRKRVERRRDR